MDGWIDGSIDKQYLPLSPKGSVGLGRDRLGSATALPVNRPRHCPVSRADMIAKDKTTSIRGLLGSSVRLDCFKYSFRQNGWVNERRQDNVIATYSVCPIMIYSPP
jgi:hypothetical protein